MRSSVDTSKKIGEKVESHSPRSIFYNQYLYKTILGINHAEQDIIKYIIKP